MKPTIISVYGLQALKFLWTVLLGVMAGLSGMSFSDTPLGSFSEVAPIFLMGWIGFGISYRFGCFSRSLRMLFVGVTAISAFAYVVHMADGGRQADWIAVDGRIVATERRHNSKRYESKKTVALLSRYTYCYCVAGAEFQGTFWERTSLLVAPEKRRIRYVNDRVTVYYDPKCPSANELRGQVAEPSSNFIFTFFILVGCLVVVIKWIVSGVMAFVFTARSRRMSISVSTRQAPSPTRRGQVRRAKLG